MPAEDTVNALAEAVRDEGAAVWRGFLGPRRCGRLREETDDLASGSLAIPYPKSTRVWDLYRHGQTFTDLLADARLDALLTGLLGEHYLLSDYSLNVVHPHQPVDDWHIDYPYNEMPTLTRGSLLGLQCILAVDPFTPDNGATRFIPRSHTPPRRPDKNSEQSGEPFLAEPGTLLVLAASTWHRSALNASQASRTAVLLSFVERWVRPMTDPPEPGPWSRNHQLRLLLGMERPPETINGVPI